MADGLTPTARRERPTAPATPAEVDATASWRRALLRPLIAVAVLAIAAGALWWVAGRGQSVKATRVAKGDAAAVVYATGIVEPVNWAKIAALQRKRIVELCRCEGKTVRKGEVLVRLDDGEERALLTELEARLKRYKEDAGRLAGLVERNIVPRTTYEEKLTQVREQESRVAAQRNRIDDLELKAPMDGVVLRRDSEVGEIAGTGANDVLLWIGDPKPLRVVAEVNEEDIFIVKAGQNVLLRHEGQSGAPLKAVVASVTPKGDPQTKTFRAYLALPDDTPLRIGMSVEANIVVDEAKDALLLPAEAIGNDGAVIGVKDGRAQRRKVETGIRGTRFVEIRKGLAEGEAVVTPYRADLADGTRLRIETDAGKKP